MKGVISGARLATVMSADHAILCRLPSWALQKSSCRNHTCADPMESSTPPVLLATLLENSLPKARTVALSSLDMQPPYAAELSTITELEIINVVLSVGPITPGIPNGLGMCGTCEHDDNGSGKDSSR